MHAYVTLWSPSWLQCTKGQKTNAKCIKNQRKDAHFEGRQDPSNVPHRHVKCNQEPSHQVSKVTNYLHTLSFPIPSDFHPIPSTKNIPSTPCFIETFEGFHRRNANALFPPNNSLALKFRPKNLAITPSTLSNPEPSWQRMWHNLKAEV